MPSRLRVREHLKGLRGRGTSDGGVPVRGSLPQTIPSGKSAVDVGLSSDDDSTLASLQPESTQIVVQNPNGTMTRRSSSQRADSGSTNEPHVGPLFCAPTLAAYTPQAIWEQALASPKISKEDREVLQENSPSDSDSLLRAVAATLRDVERKRWVNYSYTWNGRTFKIFKLLDNVTTWVDRFKSIGDIIVQYDPIHLALPWGAVRMLLQVCSHSKLLARRAKLDPHI